MNKNPWRDDGAFDDMFCDVVEISGTRDGSPFQTSLDACVFPREDVDPFVESSAESDVRKIDVLVRVRDADRSGAYRPQLGDVVEREGGDKWKVCGVEKEQNWYRITARSGK